MKTLQPAFKSNIDAPAFSCMNCTLNMSISLVANKIEELNSTSFWNSKLWSTLQSPRDKAVKSSAFGKRLPLLTLLLIVRC